MQFGRQNAGERLCVAAWHYWDGDHKQ